MFILILHIVYRIFCFIYHIWYIIYYILLYDLYIYITHHHLWKIAGNASIWCHENWRAFGTPLLGVQGIAPPALFRLEWCHKLLSFYPHGFFQKSPVRLHFGHEWFMAIVIQKMNKISDDLSTIRFGIKPLKFQEQTLLSPCARSPTKILQPIQFIPFLGPLSDLTTRISLKIGNPVSGVNYIYFVY